MVSDRPETLALAQPLKASSNSSGGWSYVPGKASRLEPTCWALMALARENPPAAESIHRAFVERCQRPNGALVEDPRWPVNAAFNAITAFMWLNHRDFAAEEKLRALLGWLTAAKGVQADQSTSYRQDNSIQGWAWLNDTFSWVEPTAWGMLALQKALQAGLVSETAARSRVADAERLLIDRCCHDGGWNFGNANVMGLDLFPHMPTTAVALLALQRRREEPAVVRSLTFLESHWADESSMLALGLSLIALRMFGRPTDKISTELRALCQQHEPKSGVAREPLSLHGLAVALTALSLRDDDTAFRI